MAQSNSTGNNDCLQVSNPLKRSTELAFLASTGDSFAGSLSPSRSHVQKRARHRKSIDRPSHVTEKNSSIQLHERAVVVDVLWPGRRELQRGTLEGVLLEYARSCGQKMPITVLCFFDCTLEHLHTMSHIIPFLHNSNTTVFGISLTAPPLDPTPVPIIHDVTRSLTLSLGLMHPLGGGRQAVDAVVVLDHEFRRRVLLPIRWGTQSTIDNPNISVAENDGVQSVLRDTLKCVEWLGGERAGEMEVDVDMETGDFCDGEMGPGPV